MVEQTFVMVKPDGVRRQLVGEIIGRFERRGLKIVELRMIRVSRELAEEHYGVHRDKPDDEAAGRFVRGSDEAQRRRQRAAIGERHGELDPRGRVPRERDRLD